MTPEDEDIRRQQEEMRPKARESGRSGNYNHNGRDPRFSALLNWVWGAFGLVALSVGGWIANSISELNNTLTRAVVQIENQGRQIEEVKGQVAQLREENSRLRGDMARIEGRVMRGIEEASR